jgi:hypothetical protein
MGAQFLERNSTTSRTTVQLLWCDCSDRRRMPNSVFFGTISRFRSESNPELEKAKKGGGLKGFTYRHFGTEEMFSWIVIGLSELGRAAPRTL